MTSPTPDAEVHEMSCDEPIKTIAFKLCYSALNTNAQMFGVVHAVGAKKMDANAQLCLYIGLGNFKDNILLYFQNEKPTTSHQSSKCAHPLSSPVCM